ncbi:MAG: glycosyltransferase family 39 protein [Ilumatobacter sp.]|uniref:glycosyltransferase family 39 protein n=1 Tax=Ilumatobacter sp. TaxID=1967498 RepID=UPI0032970B06
MIDVDDTSPETRTDEVEGDSDEVVPFVLGGRVRITGRGVVALAAVLAFALIPVRGLLRAPGSSMEEGFMLVFPRLVQQGEVPNVDFLHLYGPGSLEVLAGWYWIFGYTLEAERAFGLLQNLGIIVALYVLARPWGRTAAVLCGVVASLLTMTPIGLAALAWHGAVALVLWATVFAIRARHTESWRSWAAAGVLAGFGMSFRPDIVVAASAMLLVAGWATRRSAWKPVVVGGVVGLLPMWIHLVVAGPAAVIQGIITDPVIELRPGRELPSPPSFGEIDGALQAVAEGFPPAWPLPAPAANHQLFFWFFAVVAIAVAVPAGAWLLRRRHGSNDQIDALAIAGVFGLGILPQALQRPDSTHLAWVAMVSWPLLAAMITHVVSRRIPAIGRASVLSGGAVVLALMLVVSPFYTYRYYLLNTRVAVGDLPLPYLVERDGRKFWFGNPEVANALIAMIPDLEARSDPGDKLVVGTADLSRTVYSDVSIYFLFDELDPATYFIEMDPGLADAAGSGLAEDIEQADFVVLTNFWSGWLEPNTSVKRQSQEHNQAVADNFCLVGQYESNLLLLFERCEGGGGISGADVEGIYPQIPVPEELASTSR